MSLSKSEMIMIAKISGMNVKKSIDKKDFQKF